MIEFIDFLLTDPNIALAVKGILALIILRFVKKKLLPDPVSVPIENMAGWEILQRKIEFSEEELIDQLSELYHMVVEILREADLQGLDGAPVDEYSAEAKKILPRLKGCRSFQDVRKIIHEEFTQWFSVVSPLQDYQERLNSAADKIWKAWRSSDIYYPPEKQ